MQEVTQVEWGFSVLSAVFAIFNACPYYDLQSMGYLLQYSYNTMVRSFY